MSRSTDAMITRNVIIPNTWKSTAYLRHGSKHQQHVYGSHSFGAGFGYVVTLVVIPHNKSLQHVINNAHAHLQICYACRVQKSKPYNILRTLLKSFYDHVV